jgi:hypothetical protein
MENLTRPKLSRRKFVQRSMMAGAATSLLPGTNEAAKTTVTKANAQAPAGPNLYEQIGVRPLINAKGTYTIISGSLSLPEVKQAMEEAGRHYVNMDELMAAVGAKLAKITGAEWGIVTAGCAAAITGVHQGEIYNGNLTGKVHAQQVSFRSVMPVGGNEIEYSFAGSVAGNSMSGTVELGEYGRAQWSATRETS